MDDKVLLERHDQQIKTLFKKVDDMEEKISDMTDFKIVITKISTSMDYLVAHNQKQDTLNEKQNETLDKINQNLNELNEGQRTLNGKVEKLEKRVDENESKHNIDLRDIEKNKYTDILLKYMLPTSGALIIVLKLLEIWKG